MNLYRITTNEEIYYVWAWGAWSAEVAFRNKYPQHQNVEAYHVSQDYTSTKILKEV